MIYNSETNTIFWENLLNYPEFKQLQETPQNALWHKEGDAFKHTCLVAQKMLDYIDTQSNNSKFLDITYREILVYSALFHDFGKVHTTILGEDNVYHCPGHASDSVDIAEKFMLNHLKLDIYQQTAILSLIRYHMQPLYIMSSNNPEKQLLKLVNKLNTISIEELLLLKWCDCEGSWQEEKSNYEEILIQVRELYYNKIGFKQGSEVVIKKVKSLNEQPSKIKVGDEYSGKLQAPISIGWRTSLGFKFSTSPVVKIIDKNFFETRNSLYEINYAF